jgi:hypothetical protein
MSRVAPQENEMVGRIASTVALIALTYAVPAMAADEVKSAAVSIEGAVEASLATAPPQALRLGTPSGVARGGLLPALYVSLAGLQAYDAFSTTRGLSRGAVESNGLMKGVAGSPAAVWAIKGGVTAGSIFASERLWKSGHKMQAIGMMVATNGLMAVVGAHNSRVMGQLK